MTSCWGSEFSYTLAGQIIHRGPTDEVSTEWRAIRWHGKLSLDDLHPLISSSQDIP